MRAYGRTMDTRSRAKPFSVHLIYSYSHDLHNIRQGTRPLKQRAVKKLEVQTLTGKKPQQAFGEGQTTHSRPVISSSHPTFAEPPIPSTPVPKMVYTLYDGTIVVAQSILKTLLHILQKAEAHPSSATILSGRLRENMYALPDQIRLCTQFCENLVARLTARAPIIYTCPTTYAEFTERIEVVLAALNSADKDVVNANGEKIESTPMGPNRSVDMSGAVYATLVVLPNVYFHLSTAYGILRKEGVEVGKLDYYNGFLASVAAESAKL